LAFGLAAIHNRRPRSADGHDDGAWAPGNFPGAAGRDPRLFGIYLAARGLGWPEKTPRRVVVEWRPVSCIVASMLIFGFVLPRLGLVAALVPMFFVAALGGRGFRWREVLVLTAVMTAFAVGVFVVLLKLPSRSFPAGI
jgi:hypothetical protein